MRAIQLASASLSLRKAADLELRIKKTHINRAAPDLVDIIRSLKPYPGGNAALRALHDLDITDKHEMIIPVLDYAIMPMIRIGGSVVEGNAIDPIEDGTILARFSGGNVAVDGRNVKVGDYFNATLKVKFAHNQPFSGESVLPTLHDVTKLVDGIVQTFQAHCFGEKLT